MHKVVKSVMPDVKMHLANTVLKLFLHATVCWHTHKPFSIIPVLFTNSATKKCSCQQRLSNRNIRKLFSVDLTWEYFIWFLLFARNWCSVDRGKIIFTIEVVIIKCLTTNICKDKNLFLIITNNFSRFKSTISIFFNCFCLKLDLFIEPIWKEINKNSKIVILI